jgi:hypothetical protein
MLLYVGVGAIQREGLFVLRTRSCRDGNRSVNPVHALSMTARSRSATVALILMERARASRRYVTWGVELWLRGVKRRGSLLRNQVLGPDKM